MVTAGMFAFAFGVEPGVAGTELGDEEVFAGAALVFAVTGSAF